MNLLVNNYNTNHVTSQLRIIINSLSYKREKVFL